jgi:hypothetical protein
VESVIVSALFVGVAVGGWLIHVFVLPLPIESLPAFIFRVCYFLLWLATLIGLAGRAIVGRHCGRALIAVYGVLGLVLGWVAGLMYAGYLGMFVGTFVGPVVGVSIFCARTSPLSTARRVRDVGSDNPTDRLVGLDDVVGTWRCYWDGLALTLSIDFRRDGRFVQRIIPNQGRIQEFQNGTWTLQGAFVHLTGYVSSKGLVTESCTWWMADTPSGFALFGGEGRDIHSFFWKDRE